MKASADKSSTARSTSTSSHVHRAANQPFFAKAAGPIQPKLSVNQPGDKFEQEADRMADRVLRAPAPRPLPGAALPEERPRDGVLDRISRKETDGAPALDEASQSALNSSMAGGKPLSSEVRGQMEPHFGADFSTVRVHDDQPAATLSRRLSARAFTYQNHVFFGEGQYQPGTGEGKHLLAHELTHTVQQGHAIQRSPAGAAAAASTPASAHVSAHVSAHSTAPAPAPAQVSANAATPSIQRLGVQDALDYFADKAYYLPGYRLLCIVLGFNPINRRSEARTAANILRALVEVIPGGALVARALGAHGIFNRAGAWVEQKMAALADIGGELAAALRHFLDTLSWTDIFDLGGVWDRAKSIFTAPISRLIAFGAGVVAELLNMVREVVLMPLAALAEGTAGYDLLKAVLGQDPITGVAVPRSPELLIGGFMKLIGQEEIWQNIQKGNAIARAWAWFQGALAGLMGFVRAIPGQIVDTLRSITWEDVISITGLFAKVGRAFLNVAGQFFSWAGGQVITLLEIIFTVVAPGAIPYVKKAQGAFRSIIQNPVGFVGNLVAAGKMGFQSFAANIGTHLKTALVKWITGPLAEAGVYIPKSFELLEIVKLVLSVLGLTWTNIRAKLVKIIPEPVLVLLEKTASVLVTLARDGPAAAWQEIKNELNELKDSMIAKVTEMVTSEIVKAAVAKLVTMINPAGAVIQAIIAIYNTVTFFIQKINQIAAVVGSFIDSISAIASGQLAGAAKKVEQTMASTLTVVIAFLAKFAGLGGIPDKLVGIVRKIRAPIDKGLDKIVAWLGNLLKKLGAAAKKALTWWKKKVPVSFGRESHTLTFDGEKRAARLVLRSAPKLPSVFLSDVIKDKNVPASKNPQTKVTSMQAREGKVATLQATLAAFDDNKAPATSNAAADTASASLDTELQGIATDINTAFVDWGIAEDVVIKTGDIALSRGSFSVSGLLAIAADHLARNPANINDLKASASKNPQLTGQMVSLNHSMQQLARRHVVSSSDMIKHYEGSLVGKKVSEAKILIEQRSSIAEGRTPVDALSLDGIKTGASKRYNKFFSYARNLFIGGQAANLAYSFRLDRDHPDMAGVPSKINDHIAHVKRAWAFDSSFTPSGWP
jgi:hypothetical protein